MNTNIPSQTSQVYRNKPTSDYRDGYGQQQAPYGDQMQEKHPMQPVTHGDAVQGSQFQDPDELRSERDFAGQHYGGSTDPNSNAVQAQQPGVPSGAGPQAAAYDTKHAGPDGYPHDAYGNQQDQTSYGAGLPEKQPIQTSAQGDPQFQGDHFAHPAGTGLNSAQDQGYRHDQQQAPYASGPVEKQPGPFSAQQDSQAQGNRFDQPVTAGSQFEQNQGGPYSGGNPTSAVDSHQMPPNYESHSGPAFQGGNYANEQGRLGNSSVPGEPAVNQGQQGNDIDALSNVGGENLNEPAGRSHFGTQYDAHKAPNTNPTTFAAATGTAPTWRSDPVAKINTYLSHPSVKPTWDQTLAGGPFSSTSHAMEPSSREARHLKTSGKIEGMVGRMLGSESMQRRGEEKMLQGKNMDVQVKDLKGARKLEAKVERMRMKEGGHGGPGAGAGAPSGQYGGYDGAPSNLTGGPGMQQPGAPMQGEGGVQKY
ncbi:hypothetical protein FRB90_003281 [Tulasnella sp. 427]|nr:hypothetical protein FRB90_003281 [Tulasnella sp. 427]